MPNTRLVLFDFDGTLTNKDTLFVFIRYYHGTLKFLAGFVWLSPMLVAFKLGLIKNHVAKQKVLQHFFRGVDLETFNARCDTFAREVVPGLLRPKARQTLEQHLQAGDTVAVVSASPENWVRAWSQTYSIPCLATRLKTEDAVLTGELLGTNCYGPEKVVRVKEAFSLEQFSEIIAYGDSSGDTEMLSLANQPHYRYF